MRQITKCAKWRCSVLPTHSPSFLFPASSETFGRATRISKKKWVQFTAHRRDPLPLLRENWGNECFALLCFCKLRIQPAESMKFKNIKKGMKWNEQYWRHSRKLLVSLVPEWLVDYKTFETSNAMRHSRVVTLLSSNILFKFPTFSWRRVGADVFRRLGKDCVPRLELEIEMPALALEIFWKISSMQKRNLHFLWMFFWSEKHVCWHCVFFL